MVKSCAAEVYQPDLWVLQDSHFPPLLPVLLGEVLLVIVTVTEEDILWLEVSVGEPISMQEADGKAELVSNLSHVLDGVGCVVIVLQEIKHTLAFKNSM